MSKLLNKYQEHAVNLFLEAAHGLYDAEPSDYVTGYYVNEDNHVDGVDQITQILTLDNGFSKTVNNPDASDNDPFIEAIRHLARNVNHASQVLIEADYLDDITYNLIDKIKQESPARYDVLKRIITQAQNIEGLMNQTEDGESLIVVEISPETQPSVNIFNSVLRPVTWRDIAELFSFDDKEAWAMQTTPSFEQRNHTIEYQNLPVENIVFNVLKRENEQHTILDAPFDYGFVENALNEIDGLYKKGALSYFQNHFLEIYPDEISSKDLAHNERASKYAKELDELNRRHFSINSIHYSKVPSSIMETPHIITSNHVLSKFRIQMF